MHESFLARGRQGPIGVLFFGDSITEGWNFMPQIWNARYGAPHAGANFGIAGDRTENVLWRIEHGELEGIRPKVVVVMLGTNNVDRKPVEIARGVGAVVSAIRKRLPQTHVLLLGIFPRGADPNDRTTQTLRFRIRSANELIARMHDGKSVHYLDIGARFLDEHAFIPPEIMPDGLHPAEKGYEIWADAMQPLFDQLIR